ncbi:Capsule biosynthesis protein CapA [Legionella massiliensis]|uniref:Capsule biosynthesis protein CapA n=2 Tax=Legionella massiliensis TaxID=1034943 RepID=A0A078KZE6_9GAMM|nr:Capsule biosynthesis protein CapA [Legionella massiliensis]CEE12856.1 Capsule biosynthesis protein CapA [Legionella massiliensis]
MQVVTSVLLGGDVMLGRLVKKAILKCGVDYPMGDLSPLLWQADCVLVNLECAITRNQAIWPGSAKAFYFGAPPEAAISLANANVKMVSLANNHILDYDVQGLIDTLIYLKKEHIAYAGAGLNKEEAYSPGYLTLKKQKIAMVSFCDHQDDFAANSQSPGMAYLELSDEKKAIRQLEQSLKAMDSDTDWPILSLHWGPNKVFRPSSHFIHIAHLAIDMGYRLLFGHSAHVFQGIEIYRNCPIIYASGDLVDDYYVEPGLDNDHQLLFELRISGNRIEELRLHPIFIEYCRSLPANPEQFTYIAARTEKLCGEFGVAVEQRGRELVISL